MTRTDAYLDRIGLDPATVDGPDVETLRAIQRAHALSVPFETLSIVGHPFEDRWGAGVSLDRERLFEKIVTERRGGYCFELNGLFTWLLDALGYDADRLAAMVLGDDGTAGPPANHHTIHVDLDREYVVDVGMGGPRPRRPVPTDGTEVTGDDDVAWRVVESDRPDTERALQLRTPGADWETRFVYSTTPRDLSYFQATCDYLASAPESPFTGPPSVTCSTEHGYRKLTPDTLVTVERGQRDERSVEPGEWNDLLSATFGIPTEPPV